MTTITTAPSRPALLRTGLRLEYLTVGWNIAEGIVAVAAALASGSVALLAFGVDSFVESVSGVVMIWRLRAERTHAPDPGSIERIERRARRLISVSLWLLATWVVFDAAGTLIAADRPDVSGIGIAITSVSIGVMLWLARAKRAVAAALGSRAMQADAFQTTACWWLSLTVLGGIALNAAFGWWWADPGAALVMTAFIGAEARAAWRGDDCCGDESPRPGRAC
ncbi:MAG TPA: cation transporter [Actinomycetota bacterium]|nr:cation transporter [Actinomycetota bacterium]